MHITTAENHNNKMAFRQMTVLVVDAVDNMRVTMSAMLIDMGFKRVVQASNGSEALNLLSRQKVNIIISEWQLPKMDGIELLRKIRADKRHANVPFVMTSATIEQTEVIRAIKNGVSEYVVKPFSAKILRDRIERAMEKPVKQTATLIDNQDKSERKEKLPFQILVVDDVVDNIQIISDILRKNYKVKAATSGSKALQICSAEPQPDLVLLDIMMPEMDGLEVCKRLKSNPRTQHISVIFLTALDQTKHIVKGLELGAVDYITKPINPPVVMARVKTHAKIIDSNKLMRHQIDTMLENARLKEEFDRIMQNDLKHPLEEVLKSVEVMEKYSRDPAKVKQQNGQIKASCTQLSQMVDNMLTLSKLEDGSYQFLPTQVDLKVLLERVLDAFTLSISNKRLEIHNEVITEAYAECEELLTSSLFSNLLKNAIEAAPRGSAITIRLGSNKDYQQVELHNQGCVAEEIREMFFNKYVTHGKKQGSGIGTYAAKLMTAVQKGKIDFTTSENDGTTLIVHLPV